MYRITDILRSPDSNEVTVLCSGDSYRITAHDIEALEISVGDDIDEDIIAALEEATERLKCIKKAFDFLSYGDLSEKQLHDKLYKKFPKELSADVASLMAERGYVDDRKLAERYAETFYEFKNMGIGKIREQLYRRGISREIIDEVLEKYISEDQHQRVIEFIAKKYDKSKMADPAYKRKVYAGCIRAGFPSSDISDVLRNFDSDFESEY